jgi:hypothetical protein
MNKSEREALLSRWIKPSSDSEQDRQDRALRMVRGAMASHAALSSVDCMVYAKGSYANNTNVRLDSDVDIVVECRACIYSDAGPGVTLNPSGPSSYNGPWTRDRWRSEVQAALVSAFGSSSVDASGAVALNVVEQQGSRVTADVVPSFQYRRYTTSDRSEWHEGTAVFKRATENKIVNWPTQQLENGIEKNKATGFRYKNFVRALKHAENDLVAKRALSVLPSYLMECLVWNVPNATLTSGDLDGGFRDSLLWLRANLTTNYFRENWLEPNRLKYLFGDNQKWTVEEARGLVQKTWTRLGYGA